MSQDYLGIFDTPPGRREARLGITIVVVLLIASLAILPIADWQFRAVPASIATVDAAVFVGEIIIATVLYAQAAIFRSRALMVLASGYVFIALLLIPHALTFPGLFESHAVLGANVSTAAWIATVRRIAYPLIVILYALFERARTSVQPVVERKSANILAGAPIAVALAAAVTFLCIGWGDLLPSLFTSDTKVAHHNVLIVNLCTMGLSLGGIALLFRRYRSVLDVWLIVALSTWVIQSMVNLPTHNRYTLGWYALLVAMVVSALVVLIALIAESNRLYARLALATAARNRERQSERMSIDAVAAAISHEVGQPLTALSLNATAALSSLTSARPNVDKAIVSLREISASASRSFDVLRSIRSMFAKQTGWAGELDLNNLIRETTALLDRELAAASVSVDLSLDEHLPPIEVNRVQMQHVVSNLIVNAIESLRSTRGRRRQITIQSSAQGSKVLLEVSHNGNGIPDDAWRVFDALQGSELDSNGIRLSLCRTIVEEHGGRIWATRNDKNGATFHVELPKLAERRVPLASVG